MKLLCDPAILLLGITLKRIKSKDLHRHSFTHVPSSIMHNGQKVKEIQMSTTDEGIKKTWQNLTTKYYLALARKEILARATTQRNPEGTKP